MNNNGWSALHNAAANGKAQVVDLLLQAKASSTAVTKDGRTPALAAEQQGHTYLAVRLLQAEQAPSSM